MACRSTGNVHASGEMSSAAGLEAYGTTGAEHAGVCIGACARNVWARWPCLLGRRASRRRGGWEVWLVAERERNQGGGAGRRLEVPGLVGLLGVHGRLHVGMREAGAGCLVREG